MPEFDVSPHLESPNTGNYRIGRGYCTIELAGESEAQDAGNCPQFELTPKVETLPHFSSREGVRTKDFVATVQLEASLRFQLDEITPRNLGMFLLGNWRESPGFPDIVIHMMSRPQILAAINFVDTSSVGAQINATFPICLFTPAAAFGLIQNTNAYSTIDLTVDVLKDNVTGDFGVFTSTSYLASG
jgi:hypothetical protein